MYKVSEFTKEVYKPKDVMQLLGVTHKTLYNYDEQGKLKFQRSESGRRILFRQDLLNYLDEKGLLLDDTNTEKHDYIYARVSSNKQALSGDLDRQVLFLIEQVSDLQKPIILKEVGSGLNDQRPKLMKLMEDVMDGKVNNVYVTYKDRLTRGGYHYLEKIFHHYGVRIVVVKDTERIKSIEQELVEDLMSLIASSSGKTKKNRELAQEVLISLVAKDKLDAIKTYLDKTEEIKKEELLAIIEETEELLFE